ncbi:MAG: Sensor protein [uncultured bacterium]|nr:MAG: Sensor protein [uncultured bacterium]
MSVKENKPKILCIDDEPKNLALLEALLIPHNYDVIFTDNGKTALEKALSENPDIILLDIMMPEISGFEVLKKLRIEKKTHLIPVVMITSLKETADKIKALEAGCDDFISKPFDTAELLARIKSLIKIKSLHDEVENSYKKLKKLEKLKDSLVHMIVHDLNNPLAAISGRLQLLEMDLGDEITPKVKKNLDMTVLAVNDLTEMINSILDINRMEDDNIKLKYRNFNLHETVNEVATQMKVIADKEKKILTLEADESHLDISADRDIIKRIIINLLYNAFKFTPSGGFICIKTYFKQNEDSFYVQIKDNGTGIPEEYVDKIFDKFVQVEENKPKKMLGHGLGLAFCKLAVEAHGGKIWAKSELGKGSTFTFTIPCKQNIVS